MAEKQDPSESVRGYLQQLSPQTRGRLLAEVERLRQNGDQVPGTDLILAALRSEPRANGKPSAQLDQAARNYFKPLEPFLVDRPPEQAHAGQISRAALTAIWEWLGRDLMSSMTRDFTTEIKQFLSSGKQREVEQAAQLFQNKSVKYLEGTLATDRGAELARAKLATYSGSPATFDDLPKMLCVLKARRALTQFAQDLPARIKNFDGDHFVKTLKALNAFAVDNGDAVPFALTLVAKRLAVPWQLMRLATRAVESKDVAAIAATPYSIVVTMVMHMLDDKVDALRVELRSERIPTAKDILVALYDVEHALRVRIDLTEDSAWGRRLDAILDKVAEVLDSELKNLPAGLNHILGSDRLHRHKSLIGQVTRLGWKVRDAMTASVAYGKQIVGGSSR